MDARVIIVFGLPRSGTSWLAKVLSFDPSFTYYREPDNFDRVPGAERYFSSLYLTAEATDERYQAHMDRAVRGEIATDFTLVEEVANLSARLPPGLRFLRRHLHRVLRRRPNILLKLVNSNLTLEWLRARFPQAKQVGLIRHPCSVFASSRRQGWVPRPERLLEQSALMRDHLEPFRELLLSADTFWEKAGAYWGAVAFVMHRQSVGRPDRTILQYEWLCADSEARFRALYAQLGMQWTSAAETFLRGPDQVDSRPYSLNRIPGRQIDAWKNELSADEIESCRQFVAPFQLPYYPGFEPAATDDPDWFAGP